MGCKVGSSAISLYEEIVADGAVSLRRVSSCDRRVLYHHWGVRGLTSSHHREVCLRFSHDIAEARELFAALHCL